MSKKTFTIKNLSKTINGISILEDISFSIFEGELLSILGPSGCGKSTLLRILAGLDTASSGSIYDQSGKEITLQPPQKRNISIVFQDYSLFSHMSVFENISYPLKIKKMGKQQIQNKVKDLLCLTGLENAADKYPSELSGGMRQRVAIARALAMECSTILLDEPFSSLDALIKLELQEEIKKIQKQLNLTVLLVTHDLEEALILSDHVVVMDRGKIVCFSTPQEIVNSNDSSFIQTFVCSQLLRKYKNLKYIFDDKGGA